MSLNRVIFTSASQNWATPVEVYKALDEEFDFNYDPCPLNDKSNLGLISNWQTRTFCNPPYNEIKKWIKKGYEEYLKGNTVVFLIPSRTDTIWWHEYVMKATEIRFIKGRLKFGNAKHNAPFPSAIIIFK